MRAHAVWVPFGASPGVSRARLAPPQGSSWFAGRASASFRGRSPLGSPGEGEPLRA
ncbi:MAG: hypothetical protein OEY14_00980 [Myxococcales bacterium]|nr:hypothetical protein [Myxococcales bacterium]